MQIRTPKELGALVRARRKELGWSQQRLADESGVKRLWIVHFESGKPTVQLGLVFRALRAVGLTLDGTIQEKDSSGVDLSVLLGEKPDAEVDSDD